MHTGPCTLNVTAGVLHAEQPMHAHVFPS
jgi:hypothetical protein